MNYNDFTYNTKIQKISSAVIRSLNSGKDPFAEMLKEAQNENLTPSLVKAAVQHINNEIFLNHYTQGGEDKIQIIDPDKVIDALNIAEPVVEKTASAVGKDYWDLKKKNTLVKIAGEKYESPSDVNRTNSIKSVAKMTKIAKDKKTEFDVYAKIVKLASDIQDNKKSLYNDTLLSLRRQDLPVEEVIFLQKTASDADVKEILDLSVKRCGIRPKYDLMKNASLFEENDINHESSILKKVNDILIKKASLNKLINQYKELKND